MQESGDIPVAVTMRYASLVATAALLLTACSSQPPAETDPSTTPRAGSGEAPKNYFITQLVVLEHVKDEDVVAKFQEMGLPEDLRIIAAPNDNAVLLTGARERVNQALATIAAIDKP